MSVWHISFARQLNRYLYLSHTIVNFRSTLTEIGPGLRILEEAIFVGSLGGPDYAGTCSRRIKAGVRFVTFMALAELAVDSGIEFCNKYLAFIFACNWYFVTLKVPSRSAAWLSGCRSLRNGDAMRERKPHGKTRQV